MRSPVSKGSEVSPIRPTSQPNCGTQTPAITFKNLEKRLFQTNSLRLLLILFLIALVLYREVQVHPLHLPAGTHGDR